MNDSENVHELESDLENEKRALREDFEQISEKTREIRAELSPTNLVRERIYLFSGLALVLGFVLGYRDSRMNRMKQ
jgi:predicted  nucleic acid-binding Zn-ribbon protein